MRAEPQPAEAAAPLAMADPQTFAELVVLFEIKREGILHAHLFNSVHLISFEPGKLAFRRDAIAPRNLNLLLKAPLERWTGRNWQIFMDESMDGGAPTLSQQAHKTREAQKVAAAANPLVDAVLQAFPGATIEKVRGVDAPTVEPQAADDVVLETPDELEE
jgi:DNA polymerase-3 subunit gamma/tau